MGLPGLRLVQLGHPDQESADPLMGGGQEGHPVVTGEADGLVGVRGPPGRPTGEPEEGGTLGGYLQRIHPLPFCKWSTRPEAACRSSRPVFGGKAKGKGHAEAR